MSAPKKKPKPSWYAALRLPPRTRARLESKFTLHRDGYVIWYKGAVRFAAGRKVAPEKVEAHWDAKRKAIDADAARAPAAPMRATVKGLLSLYVERQRRRVESGRPKPLSPFTLEDQIRTLRDFAKTIGADRDTASITPSDFADYGAKYDTAAASTVARKIAYIKSMFAWGVSAGECEAPTYGPDFVKPTASERMDERLGKSKSYTPAEIAAIWAKAKPTERLWIALAVNGALDNSDIANLTYDIIDFGAATIDYRRRKSGKIRRLIPLHTETLTMLLTHKGAADPAPGAYVFRTPKGHMLVRMRDKGNGRSTPIDYIAFRWTKLLQKAGIRPKAKRVTIKSDDGTFRRQIVWGGKSDGRGFRGLRTTFANNIPPGYGDERQIIMGHSHGTTFLNSYLETIGVKRLRELVNHVWGEVFKDRPLMDQSATASGSAPGAAAGLPPASSPPAPQ